jgi:homoprotocatechuate degradation regulator HpaR
MKSEIDNQDAQGQPTSAIRPFSRSLPMALLRAREAAMRQFRPSLHAHDLTEQQWRVLRALGSLEVVDATQLAALTFLLAPSLTRILRDLEARKLIRRRANPKDRRAALISLNVKGLDLIRTVGAESERIYHEIETHIGAERLAQLMRLLDEVEARLGESASRGD